MISILVATVEQKESFQSSMLFPILTTLLSGLIGSIIGTLITVRYARNDAKKRLIVDISTQELLPNVYKPILSEYQRVLDSEMQQSSNMVLKTKVIEQIIVDNRLSINMAPRKIKSKILIIYSICKTIKLPQDYHDKLPKIKSNLAELKTELEDEFEVYLK